MSSRPQRPRPQPQRPQQPLQQQPAAKGSLRSLILQHSTERLYVHPLQWNTRHLSLLCCNVIDDQLNAKHCRPIKEGFWKERACMLWKKLPHMADIDSRDAMARVLMHSLGENALTWCKIRDGRLVLHYNEKPVCSVKLPVMAWYKKTLLWAFMDWSWIDQLHQARKPWHNISVARAKRAVAEKDLSITPFCMAVMLAMAQQAGPGNQVTLFLLDHEKPSKDEVISTFYEYRLKASQEYLSKFDHPYRAFESELIIHRRVIPIKQDLLEVLSDAVQRAVYQARRDAAAKRKGSNHLDDSDNDYIPITDDQAETTAISDRDDAMKREAMVDLGSNIPVTGDQAETTAISDRDDAMKRKAMDDLDSNIPVKQVKYGNHKGKEKSHV